MKKTILILSMLMVVVYVSAQSKKEMLQTITEQSQTIGELKGKISSTEKQLQEANGTIAKLQEEIASLKSAQAQNNKPMTYRDSLLDLRSKFYACETWQEQLQYVMEPQRVKPLMEKYYKDNPYSVTLCDNEGVDITRLQGKSHVLYLVNNNWIVKTDNGYKIDLEATWSEQSVFYGATKKEVINNPNKEFEVRGSLLDASEDFISDYYLIYVGLWDASHFYIKKNSPIARKLQNLNPKDDWVVGIFKVKYDGKKDGENTFTITEIVYDKLSKY